MPRLPRKKSHNGIYHIMLRGINKQTIFEDDEDKLRMLETIKKYKAVSKFKIYCYCFMDNHVHLLIKETEEPVSKAINRISVSYVYWYNNKYERCGHLFQNRFRSENVETQGSFLRVLRYIHQNPVKAGLSKHVFECKWTSIHEYTGTADLVDVDEGLGMFSPDRGQAIKMFTEYMLMSNNDQCLDDKIKVRMSDNEVRVYLDKMGIVNKSTLQQLDKDKRNAVILQLKELRGVSIRQLARITGISKSVIDRVR
ncbi:transposase [Heyndrickxia sp. NPDC080065]|uniref:transposase n=1 Tax=Heyndrickxia sp. NPDC080065 TaxID=3390568 RepID=UPI003CFCE528